MTCSLVSWLTSFPLTAPSFLSARARTHRKHTHSHTHTHRIHPDTHVHPDTHKTCLFLLSSVPEALLEAAEAGVGHHVDHRGEDGVDADGGGLVVKETNEEEKGESRYCAGMFGRV